MVKVQVSVLTEYTDDWFERFTAYWREVKASGLLMDDGYLYSPDESCELLDELKRKYEISTINHL